MLKLAVIGCGTIADEEHLPAFSAMKDVELVAFADIDREHLNRQADRYSVAARYRDYREMLEKEEIDAVTICTPNYLHAPITIDCCKAGKYVLVEKPAATSMAEIRRMKAAADKAGVFIMVEQTHRFNPITEKAREVVKSGMLGKVVGMNATVRSGGPSYWSPTSKWFFKKSEAFGGVLADTGIHIIDSLRWMSGLEIAKVQGFTTQMVRKGDVEDAASITFQTSNGVLGVMDSSWNQQPYALSWQIFGEKGYIESINYKGLRGVMREPRSEITFTIADSSVHGSPFRYFIDCVTKKEKPFVDILEGGRSLAVVLAGYRSAKMGKTAVVEA